MSSLVVTPVALSTLVASIASSPRFCDPVTVNPFFVSLTGGPAGRSLLAETAASAPSAAIMYPPKNPSPSEGAADVDRRNPKAMMFPLTPVAWATRGDHAATRAARAASGPPSSASSPDSLATANSN